MPPCEVYTDFFICTTSLSVFVSSRYGIKKHLLGRDVETVQNYEFYMKNKP